MHYLMIWLVPGIACGMLMAGEIRDRLFPEKPKPLPVVMDWAMLEAMAEVDAMCGGSPPVGFRRETGVAAALEANYQDALRGQQQADAFFTNAGQQNVTRRVSTQAELNHIALARAWRN